MKLVKVKAFAVVYRNGKIIPWDDDMGFAYSSHKTESGVRLCGGLFRGASYYQLPVAEKEKEEQKVKFLVI